uniref:Uncharacterized protein n=1 Tax=Lactuca sativa TaxID=4236 RepID=A0A9R1W7D4_LACSA|nr:hypothetical protein LSAT_V11C300155970 [Lactuca sativa]
MGYSEPQKWHLLLSPSPSNRSKTRLDVYEEATDLYSHVAITRSNLLIYNKAKKRRVNNKPKKMRHNGRSKKEKSISFPSVSSPRNDEDYGYNFDRSRFLINDLIMWNDAAKSTLFESKRNLKLKGDDILKASRVILLALNLVISKA